MTILAKRKPWVDLAVFEDLHAALTVEVFLARIGFEVRTYDDKLFRYFLFLRPPRVTFRVQVRQDQLKTTVALLAAGETLAMQQAIRCPSCDSLRVSYPQMTRKFILPTVLLHLGILLRLIEHECYCDRCHFIWNLPEKNPRPKAVGVAPFPLGPVRTRRG
jgi:hypothetical protein